MRYAITNLSTPGPSGEAPTAEDRERQWLDQLRRWTAEGIDFVQLREKSLDAGELCDLATKGMRLLAASSNLPSSRLKLLVNGRPDIAAAARADGVHLTSRPGEFTPAQARTVFTAAGLAPCLVSISCHTPDEAERARKAGADLILFGPVFEKSVAGQHLAHGAGLHSLRSACATASMVPVLALGGVTAANAPECLAAGAAGIAAIRLFSS